MRVFPVVAVLLIAAPLLGGEAAGKGEKLKSGFEKGAGVPAFTVLDVTGPNSGKSLCYV